DRVKTTVMGMFLNAEDYYGTIVLWGGEPWVKVDGKITVSKKGRLYEASRVRWTPSWKKVTATDAEPQAAQQPAQAGEKAPQVAGPRNDIADGTPVVIIDKRIGQAADIGIYRGTDARTGSARVEVAPGEIILRHPGTYEVRPMSGDGRNQSPAEKSEPTAKAKRGRAGTAALKKLAKAAGLSLDDTDNRDTADMIAFFDRFYEAGRAGRDMPRADIHPQDARAAYEAGRKDREAASQAPKAPQAAAGDGPAATGGNARPAPAAAPTGSVSKPAGQKATPSNRQTAKEKADAARQ